MTQISVKGINIVKNNLNKINKNSQIGFYKGIVQAGLYLQRESQKITPVDTGALVNSAFTDAVGNGFLTKVTVGYRGVYYAPFVHEHIEYRHKPGKQAKFLEQPAREKRPQMLKIIADQVGYSLPIGISKVGLVYGSKK
jgi:hypothetical protein